MKTKKLLVSLLCASWLMAGGSSSISIADDGKWSPATELSDINKSIKNRVSARCSSSSSGCSSSSSGTKYCCQGTIGDYVWIDSNKNGYQDAGEDGLVDVKVTLYKSSNGNFYKYKETTTNSSGNYIFKNVCSGTYKIKFTPSEGWKATSHKGSLKDTKNSDIYSNNFTQQFYFNGTTIKYSCSKSNKYADNIKYIDAGFYYQEQRDIDIDIEKSTNGQDADSGTGPVVAVGSTVTWKYVVTNNSNVKLSNIVVKDNKEGTISCPKSTLDVDESMTCTKTGKAKVGQYANIATVEGKNCLTSSSFSKRIYISNNSFQKHNTSGWNFSKNCQARRNSSYSDGDGYFADAEAINKKGKDGYCGRDIPINSNKQYKATIKALYYGTEKENEKKVYAVYLNGNHQPISSTLVQMPITNNRSQGMQNFSLFLGKAPGSAKYIRVVAYYKADVSCSTGGVFVDDLNVYEDTPETTNCLTATDSDPSHYYGKIPDNASLGDYIWYDKNQNGIQDAGESGVAGVKVELLDSNGDIAKDIHGNLINTVTTDNSGKYHFNNLGKGSYIVKITTPNGYIVTKKEQGNDKTKDSDIDPTTGKTDIINLDIGVDDNSWDGGIYQLNSSIDIEKSTNGEDADNTNGPEIKVGEKVIWEYNVTNRGNVKLTNIVVKDNKEGVINCPKTELNAGESMVCVKEGVAKKGKYENEAIVTAKDPTGESKSDKDPSHYYGKAPSCLGDYIWEDSNKNGIQDSNESAISGAKVELFDNSGNIAKDIDGNSITPIITNANGKYIFCNLDSGNYIVKVTPPTGFSITKKDQGTNDTKDSDIDPKTGETTTIYLPEDTNDTKWDGGLYPNSGTGEHNHTGTACLGNYLWLDRNLNGIQDSNEPGVINIKVELYDATTNKLIARTKTDGDGKYQFCKLKPGKYKVKFALPNTYLFTLQNRGDDMRDSDVDSSGWTQVVTLEAGEKNLTLDAGIYCECDDYKIHPERYKKSSASISIFGSFALLIFIIFATSTLKYKRD